ncbi:thioredoxin domain-containing protein [Methanolobus sp. WCC4]|uniref:thioredoxin family protein n=1 Tax=Methanolobus sp. WCC4 TaxID=3125784 RepID=UPI0030F7D5F9
MPESNVLEVNDSNWEELLENQEKPMVVMFYLPTCTHCKEIEPYFRDYSNEFHDSCTFVRMNGLESPMTARKYGVRGTPTFKFFCKGRAIKEEVGLVYPSILRKSIEELVKHGDECILHTSPMPDEVSPYE